MKQTAAQAIRNMLIVQAIAIVFLFPTLQGGILAFLGCIMGQLLVITEKMK